MKRRELIKLGLAGATACALAGCANREEDASESAIEPKQTDVYKISTTLPFNYKFIDDIAEMNSRYKKSQVKTLYNNIPLPLADNYNNWVNLARGTNDRVQSVDDFIDYAKYAMDKGFEICYLMNSPKCFSEKDFNTFKDDFYKLLDRLYNANITHIKVANTQVATLINDYNAGFKLSASTAFEYHNTSQYVNLVENYPNFALFDIAIDENHNFPFLRNMKKIFPKVEIELMVNEMCIKGCPARISHISELVFCKFNCKRADYDIKKLFKMPAIFPWDLEYYSAIGINNFKITSRDFNRALCLTTEYLDDYLNCVENGPEGYDTQNFMYDMYWLGKADTGMFANVELADLIPYLQDIRYFTKYGDLCASRCNATCNRCEKLGERLEKFLKTLS